MTKKNLILLAILIVLASLAYYYQVPYRAQREENNRTPNFLASLQVANLNKISIKDQAGSVTLYREGSDWFVQGADNFPANFSRVQSLLSALAEATTTPVTIISENLASRSSFGLDDKHAITISLQSDDSVTEFQLGKSNPTYSYLARANDNKTYQLAVALTNLVAVTEWRQLQLFSSSLENITKVSIANNQKLPSLNYFKQDQIWRQETESDKSSSDQIQALVDNLSYLTAVNIVSATTSPKALAQPKLTIKLTENERDYKFELGALINKFYYVRLNNQKFIYLINQNDLEPILTIIAKLR